MSVLPRMSCPADNAYDVWLELLSLQAGPELLRSLGDSLAAYLHETGLGLYVLGLSGGLDSSFLAALLHTHRIPYLGFCLPITSNTPAEIERAILVARAYANPPEGTELDAVCDLSTLYMQMSRGFALQFPASTPIAEGNLKARIRMQFLYHAASLHGGCVLATDQLDELLMGFWTLHGDVGDISPLQFIPKTVEYELARMLCRELAQPEPLQAAIDAVPTDGLGISASDLDQLGVDSYADVEALLRRFFQLKLAARTRSLKTEEQAMLEQLVATVPVQRFLASGYKRSGPVFFDPRMRQ
ncbi:hypothetical protein MASR1M90_16920 [Desulfovibrionales bacterium]